MGKKYEVFIDSLLSQLKANGDNATAAAVALSIPDGTARKWRIKAIKLGLYTPAVMVHEKPAKKAFVSRGRRGRIHMILPDVQVKPGQNLDHLVWAGKYAAKRKPDVIVCIGDFADMPSLSSYDWGKKSFEGRRYKSDISHANLAMMMFMHEIWLEQQRLIDAGEEPWNPRLVFTLGNHEERILRAVNDDPKMDGTIGLGDLNFRDLGWEVHNYLDVVVVDGVAYSHFFTSGTMGRPVSSPTALLNKKHMSAVMGHVQDRGIAYGKRADGSRMTGLFCGCYYQHDEEYLGSQGNDYWRGIWMLHDVKDGSFDEMPVSMKYLKMKYGE